MQGGYHANVWFAWHLTQRRPRRRNAPRPGVAKPKRRKQVQRRWLRSAVLDADLNKHIVRGGLGVFDEDVEIAVVIENAGVDQFVLEFVPAAAAVGVDKLAVRIRNLRILIQ